MLTKKVNGKTVTVSDSQAAALQAEWDINAAKPAPEPKPTLDDVIALLKSDPVLSEKLDTQVAERVGEVISVKKL